MEKHKYKVYIKTDERNRILCCEGGYTMGNIKNIEEWILIDEGIGDKYNLCQSHYLEGGIYTEDFIPRWKYANGEAVLRTDAEIEADRNALPPPPAATEDDLMAMAVEQEFRLTLLELGV
jgi:hypothetical protein